LRKERKNRAKKVRCPCTPWLLPCAYSASMPSVPWNQKVQGSGTSQEGKVKGRGFHGCFYTAYQTFPIMSMRMPHAPLVNIYICTDVNIARYECGPSIHCRTGVNMRGYFNVSTLRCIKSKSKTERSESEFLVNNLWVFLILFGRNPHLRSIRKQNRVSKSVDGPF
jgi:hypothetical protein